MNTQQRRPFFPAGKSGGSSLTSTINWGRIARVLSCERILAALAALLFFGCASLTPDRVAVLAAIAGQAAQVGAQNWLAKHPDQKPIFDAVIVGIAALIKGGVTNQAAYVELLKALPVSTLAGPDGAVTWQTNRIIILDSGLKKAVPVVGAAEQPVIRATVSGLRRAVAPMPPVPEPVPLTGTNRVKRGRVR